MTEKQEPILLDGKLGGVTVLCKECRLDYDLRDVSNPITVPPTSWPFLRQLSFDCPKGHHCESIEMWNEHNFLRSCGIAPEQPVKKTREELEANCFGGGTPEERQRRLCLSACVTAEVQFCGIRRSVLLRGVVRQRLRRFG